MNYISLHLTVLSFLGSIVSCVAQIKSASIGVDGLTCSQCSRSVELSLRKLDFVSTVDMNLAQTNGNISFKPGVTVDFKKIARAVVDAGFSVRGLKAEIALREQKEIFGQCLDIQGNCLVFIGNPPSRLDSSITVTFIGKEFMSKKDLKPWKGRMQNSCDNGCEIVNYVTY